MVFLKEQFPPLPEKEWDERTQKASKLLRKIAMKAREKNWRYVTLSGFAIDAYLGYVSRNHKDVDFIIDKNDIEDVKAFLVQEGHVVCESKKYGPDLLRVDPVDKETTRAAHCDIHISFFDTTANEVVIPMLGKEIRFQGNYGDIAIEKDFLGARVRVLLPELLIEEKKGWIDKIGLPLDLSAGREEKNDQENKKLQAIVAAGVH